MTSVVKQESFLGLCKGTSSNACRAMATNTGMIIFYKELRERLSTLLNRKIDLTVRFKFVCCDLEPRLCLG